MLNNVLSAAAVAAAGFGITTLTVFENLPRPDLGPVITIHRVEAARDGAGALIDYARTIHRAGEMTYTVRIMARGPDGVSQVCAMTMGPMRYSPDARLPERIDLDWWTNGECPALPDGPAEIWTTWAPEDDGLSPITVITEVRG